MGVLQFSQRAYSTTTGVFYQTTFDRCHICDQHLKYALTSITWVRNKRKLALIQSAPEREICVVMDVLAHS
ncbi:hypothetical protein Y032_0048g1584 [Ancylostoma ceylanicum]|uniref:Uncharacterized protein n=1 Tax=Ancylostoma ceylanicum TaxID=53326 RepID=A0A016UA94_9BILA|nr:hypothetical protein Y032_0048g1584 [Ancylostoma ceylanicum]